MKRIYKLSLLIYMCSIMLLITACNKNPAYKDAEPFTNGFATVQIDNYYGYLNEEGKLAIPAEYHAALPFFDGYAIVSKYSRWGVIDENNNTVIPLQYEELEQSINNKYIAKKNGVYGIIDKDNNIIVGFKSKSIPQLIYNNNDHEIYMIPDDKELSVGLIDLKNNFELPADYGFITSSTNPNVLLLQNPNNVSMHKYGIINLENYKVIEPVYEEIPVLTDHDTMWACMDGKWSEYTLDGEKVSDTCYDSVSECWYGLHSIALDNKWGCMDSKGNVLIEPYYDSLDVVSENLINATKHRNHHVLDSKGEENKPLYSTIVSALSDDYYCATPTNQGLEFENIIIDKNGNPLFYSPYDILYTIGDDNFVVNDGVHSGCINSRGIVTLPFDYNNITTAGDYFIVSKNNKYGIVNKQNKFILDAKYTQIHSLNDDIYLVTDKEKCGLFNSTTETFTGLIYDDCKLGFDDKSNITVKKDGTWIFLDSDFKNVFE